MAIGRYIGPKFSGGIGVIPISNVAVDATTSAVTVTRKYGTRGQFYRSDLADYGLEGYDKK